jgi:hypothetical protein
MRFVFRDGISVFNRPDVVIESDSLDILHQYDKWQYAYSADVFHNDAKLMFKLVLGDDGYFNLVY